MGEDELSHTAYTEIADALGRLEGIEDELHRDDHPGSDGLDPDEVKSLRKTISSIRADIATAAFDDIVEQ
jgi:hypothetical protein